ncbi:hypothetical protein CATRI_09125 [Corynebacterium atrinae]|uniref:hypothetical protein n=1 Tax=Corynebacterium atrinae TaxID=1336740 RepID=UPI0025B290B3|nr:hypothetical protein [Corynebacterium atrinae]WJY63896.1 hypothetical protein CATRI_09125 [Corynebacterium atrinae]
MSIWNKLFGESEPSPPPHTPEPEAHPEEATLPSTPSQLRHFIESTAAAADADVTNVLLMLDPGSSTSGSLRLTKSDQVHDLSFDLATPAGAQAAVDQVRSIIS